MIKLLKKDKRARISVCLFEDKRIILKNITNNAFFLKACRWNAVLNLTDLPQKSIKFRLTNRCVLTGRTSKQSRRYKFSRLAFLRLARAGHIKGLVKSAW